MLTNVINQEYEKIDDQAVRDKQIVGYIAGLVQKNHDKLTEVTGTDDGRRLYDFLEKALDDIDGETELYGDPESLKKVTEEAVLLGWIEIGEYCHRCYIPRDLTGLGRKVVEDYKRFKESIGVTE